MAGTTGGLDASDWIAVGSFIIAIGSLAIAYWQFHNTRAITKLAHMNGLFRDALRLEFDYHNTPNTNAAERAIAADKLISYKTWVLEEMWIWLHDLKVERRSWFPEARKKRKGIIGNWTNTLNYHIEQVDSIHWPGFVESRGCYHIGFYSDVIRHLRTKGHDYDPSVPPAESLPSAGSPASSSSASPAI